MSERPVSEVTSHIFICFSSKDETIARGVVDFLEAYGLKCWISARDVPPGQNYQETIVHALERAQGIVFLFSEHSSQSAEIKKELSIGGSMSAPVFPLRLSPITPTGALRYELATRQWIDIFPDRERALRKLIETIQEVLAVPAVDAPDVPIPEPSARTASVIARALGIGAAAGKAKAADASAAGCRRQPGVRGDAGFARPPYRPDRQDLRPEGGDRSALARERYRQILNLNVVPHIGAVRVQKLRPVHLSELYAKLQRSGGCEGRALSARSVGHVHRVLHRALGHAATWGVVAQNVASLVSPPSVPETEITIQTEDQIGATLRHLEGRTLRPIVSFLLGTGARRGEALALRWKDIDLAKAVVRIERSQTKAGLRFKAPKTKNGRRNVKIS